MALNRYIKILLLFSIASFFGVNQVLANTYTSEIFSSLSSCESQKEKNNSLYPNFYRSHCVESSQGKFHYNICDTNYCVATSHKNKLVEARDPGVYDYDNNIGSKYTTDYQLDEKTQQHIEKIANKLEKRFQKMSVSDLDKWNDNFINVIDKLSERSKNSKKNLALLQGVKKEVNSVVEKQKKENNLCKQQYGEGWKEAKIFDIEAKTVEWIKGNMKYTLACEYNEPKIVLPKEKDEENNTLVDDNQQEKKSSGNGANIDVYTPPLVTDEPNNKIDITEPIQGLYRATSKKYQSSQTYRYTKIDVCVKEFGLDWQESTQTNADPYIMLYNKYGIETSGYTQYWNGKKLVLTPKNKLVHKACVKNNLSKIINNQYTVTRGKYRGNILREGDICKKEYGNEWKVSKDKYAYEKVFNYHSNTYPGLRAWQTFDESGRDNCGGFHGNDSWNGTVYTMDKKTPSKYAASCSFDTERKEDSIKYHNHFVCERDNSGNEDITPIVQDLYKITQNKYFYSSAFNKDYDFCKVEYGRSWKTSKAGIDSNIMLYKQYGLKTWIYDPAGGKFAWSGDKEIQQTANDTNHIACVEDIYHYYNENYQDYYESATVDEVHKFMKSVENEIQSKIKETDRHIIFNNKYAITKQKYYGNQIYSARNCPDNAEYCNNGSEISGVCPIGYKLDEHTLYYNNYEKEIIGYYLSNNINNYNSTRENNGEKYGIHLWKWGKYDEKYSREFSLDRIKKESQTLKYSTHKMILVNPGLSLRKPDKYSKYHYWNDLGSSEKVGALLPALCVNKQAEINTSVNKDNIVQDFKGIKAITDPVYMNESDIEGSSGIFYSYGKMIASGFFEKSSRYGVTDQQFFLPIRKHKGSTVLLFMKKFIK